MMTKDIEVFTHSSIRITERDLRIYIDPFQFHRERNNADYILITHDHHDHFSPSDIQLVAKPSTILVVPENMLEKAKEVEGMVAEIRTVKPGETYDFGDFKVETVAAGQRIYIAGDTDETEEALNVVCDVALVLIGGTFTMDAREAARLINNIRPKVAIPTHYGSVIGSRYDAETFRDSVDFTIPVEVKMLHY